MSIYTTAKCGHCGINWTTSNLNTPTAFGQIGPPVIKCGSCLKDNNTGLKFVKDLNVFQKLLFVYFIFQEDVSKIELLFEKNGGFIWSYEMYPPN
jgi:hypothetical protein